MTTANLQRLRRVELELAKVRRELEIMRPLCQWALSEIMAEQESRLRELEIASTYEQMRKNMNIKNPPSPRQIAKQKEIR